jgi:Domain of unknown function (DUF4252)
MTQRKITGLVRMAAIVAMFVAAAASMQAMGGLQQKDDLFAGADKFAAGAKSTTEVNLDKNMLGMVGKFVDDGPDKNGVDLARKMDFVIVHAFEYESAGQYKMSDVEEFRKRLEDGGWSHIVKERSATESTDVCVKVDKDGQFSELVVITAEPKELTFVHLKGHMSMDDLAKAGAHYGVPQGGSDVKKKDKDKEKTK